MERSNAKDHGYTGTALAVKILEANPQRSYICFYAVEGSCEISIGSANFDTVRKVLPDGVMWEPEVAFIQEVWYRGDATKLCVTY